MRIPLDYYRILGLPIQASAEQLQQAYRDRTLQLPRREYSEAAIAARKQLIEEAYAVLSNPEKRAVYDANYLAYSYDLEADPTDLTTQEQPEPIPTAVDLHTPNIEITDEQFVGALLILQELGEYELVLKLGRPYLSSSSVNLEGRDELQTQSYIEPDLVRSDVVLTVALACLELGREQWQQGQYENAATSLETGQDLLLRQGLFPSVRGEIQADLYKLRPYRILELLAHSKENSAERRQGLKLLQNILQERAGIDGTGNDGSGLGIDDFLRFIQQLRSYLTAAEQQNLFEAESQRPSAVATYLAVYALIARGFTQRQPALIRQAKLLLMRLGKRQDVHLEQAVCALLLGQTEQASRALELSQEYEPLAFIREHSQGSPDLLPGLCLYGERWLQTEVFPHFLDLTEQQASLKDYFADEQVQAYLEALPQEAPTNEWTVVVPQSPSYTQGNTSRRPDSVLSESRSSSLHAQRVRDPARSMPTSSYGTAVVRESVAVGFDAPTSKSRTATATLSASPEQSVTTLPAAERIGTMAQTSNGAADATSLLQRNESQRSRRRTRKQIATGSGVMETGETRVSKQGSITTLVGIPQAKTTRVVLLAIAGALSLIVCAFLLTKAYSWLKQTFFPVPTLQGEQPLVQLAQPLLQIPAANAALLSPEGALTEKTAEEVIQRWLSTKAAAFGPDHAIEKLEQILVNPALSQWQEGAKRNKADNQYRQYKHNLKVASVEASKPNPDKAQVVATVNEVAQVYSDGQLNKGDSYDENLRVRYDLARKDGNWRIKQMTVLK